MTDESIRLTGGRFYFDGRDEFEPIWLALLSRGNGGWTRAHYYTCDGSAFRAVCGKHIVDVCDAVAFHPGNWLRCAHCQKIVDRRWH